MSTAALRQRHIRKARDIKVRTCRAQCNVVELNGMQIHSNITSETSPIQTGSSSPTSDYGVHEKSDDEETYHTKEVKRGSFDVSAIQSLLKKLNL